MLTKNQQTRIAKRCADAILEAVSAFPAMLGRIDQAKAAVIVADLIKSQTSRSDDPDQTYEETFREIDELIGDDDD